MNVPRRAKEKAVADTGKIREHMEVIGSCGKHVGFVDRVEGRSIKLTTDTPQARGEHRYIPADWVGQEKHGTDDRVINARAAGDEVHLFYREVHHTPFEYKGRVLLLNAARRTDGPSRFVFRLEHDQGPADDLERFRDEVEAIPDVTEREEVRKARVGQGLFRRLLLERWGARCAVTGVDVPSVLTAAHIKPWRCASNAERLDPGNGLLVLPQYDRLFDRGLISFADDGAILLSEALPRGKLPLLGVREDARLSEVDPAHRPYLSFHRDRVFVRGNGQE
jgi:hypothetical protein